MLQFREILLAMSWAREHQRQALGVIRMHENGQQVQHFLYGTDASGKHDDGMGQAHEGLQPLLDIRHDHQLVDNGIGRLGSDDTRLADTNVAAVLDLLLGMPHRCAFHRPFHGADTAAGNNIQPAQAQGIAHMLGVVVLLSRNSVATPAHDHARRHIRTHHIGIA